MRTGVNAGPCRYTDSTAQSAHVAIPAEGSPLSAKPVQRRRPYCGIAIRPDRRSAVIVGDEEEYTWLRRHWA